MNPKIIINQHTTGMLPNSQSERYLQYCYSFSHSSTKHKFDLLQREKKVHIETSPHISHGHTSMLNTLTYQEVHHLKCTIPKKNVQFHWILVHLELFNMTIMQIYYRTFHHPQKYPCIHQQSLLIPGSFPPFSI